MAAKIDFKKDLDSYQAKRGQVRIIEVPNMQYLMIDGHGDPNTSAWYAESLRTLYPVAYKLKFASKRDLGRDYVVPPLEGLWWAADMDVFTVARDKSLWDWTMMIMTPDWIDQAMLEAVREQVDAEDRAPLLSELRLEPLPEGRCVQTLHVGSFDDEAEVLAWMHHEYIPRNGLSMVGKHHEIYLSDPRRTAPAKLRTILRQPVNSAGSGG